MVRTTTRRFWELAPRPLDSGLDRGKLSIHAEAETDQVRASSSRNFVVASTRHPSTIRGRRKYTTALRREVVAYVKAGIDAGRSQMSMVKELAIRQATFADWLTSGYPQATTSYAPKI